MSISRRRSASALVLTATLASVAAVQLATAAPAPGVPGGIVVAGSTFGLEDGYGMRLIDDRWESLDLPADGDAKAFPAGVLDSAGKLTVVGVTRPDQSGYLRPLVLTSRG